MATSPDQVPGTPSPSSPDHDAVDSPDDSGPRREEDLDPDGQDAELEPLGAGEDDLDPDDDSVDPEEMNIPPADRDG